MSVLQLTQTVTCFYDWETFFASRILKMEDIYNNACSQITQGYFRPTEQLAFT